jgi:hypothetical protein
MRSTSTLFNIDIKSGEWLASRSDFFTLEEKPQYVLDRRLAGPQSWAGHGDEEKSPAVLESEMNKGRKEERRRS